MIFNYRYILLYFITVQVYSKIVIFWITFYRKKLNPWLSERFAILFHKKACKSGYISAWEEICEDYMYKNDFLIGRLYKNGQLMGLGQISHISPNPIRANKDISFINQEDYLAYFPQDKKPLLEHLCTYVDLNVDYVLELYRYDENV